MFMVLTMPLWDELRKECEEPISKGITGTGEGFDLPGRRLGGLSDQPPLSSLHKTALVAAEKRAKLGSLLPSGLKRLGGDSTIMGALSPIQAASMAAERRLRDEAWCGSHFAEAVEDAESGPDIALDLTGNSVVYNSGKRNCESNKNATSLSSNGHSESNPVDLSTEASTSGSILDPGSRPKKRTCNTYKNFCDSRISTEAGFVDFTNEPTAGSALNNHGTNDPLEPATWECAMCTLLNPIIGKALVLDDIINYIQSLQRQAAFLSTKLEAVDSRMNMQWPLIEGFHPKDVGVQPFDDSGMIFGQQAAREYAQGSQV